MSRSKAFSSLRQMVALLLTVGVMNFANTGCDVINEEPSLEPVVPVYGLPVDGTVDPNVILDNYLVILAPDATKASLDDMKRRLGGVNASVSRVFDLPTLHGFVVTMSREVLEQVRYFSDIAWIEANRHGDRTGIQTCPPGNLDAIDTHATSGGTVAKDALLDQVYAYGSKLQNGYVEHTGKGVHVVVVDTGLDKALVGMGGDFNQSEDGASDAFFPHTCESNDTTHGHGTMVAEVIAGRTLGVAKNATIVGFNAPNYRCYHKDLDPAKTGCLPDCGQGCPAECFDIVNNACKGDCKNNKDACKTGPTVEEDALALGYVATRIDNLPKPLVVVFPHAFSGNSPTLQTAVKSIIAKGVVFVTGAGNDGQDACDVSPALLSATEERVISVGSLTWQQPIQLRHPNSCVDVYAPGVNVRTKRPNATCNVMPVGEGDEAGSSFAAAHVAGIVALMLEEDPSTEGFKTNRFLPYATGELALTAGSGATILHSPYNMGESGKIGDKFDADDNEDKISCTSESCVICGGMGATNPCNPQDPSCTGRLRCTETECAPCGREGSRCCSMGVKCDGNLECNSTDFCACGEKDQVCCNGSPAEQCGAGLACSGNTCVECGTPGKACCNESGVKTCGTGLACSGDTCVGCGGPGQACCNGWPSEQCDVGLSCAMGNCLACGGPGQDCCDAVPMEQCAGGLTCDAGKCLGCGGPGQSCCSGAFGDLCGAGLLCGADSKCAQCGGPNDACCVDAGKTYCLGDELQCMGGHCKDCGKVEQSCCDDGSCQGDMACVNGTCKALCRVRCRGGQYIETYSEALTNAACLAWTESECLARGFLDHQSVWFNGDLLFNREANYPGTCGGTGSNCCHKSNPHPQCSDSNEDCVEFSPLLFVPPMNALGYQICSECGHAGKKCCNDVGRPRCAMGGSGMSHDCKPDGNGVDTCHECGGLNNNCCANDKCGIGFTCRSEVMNGPKTCQPCGSLNEPCCAAPGLPPSCALGLECVLTGMPGPGPANELTCQVPVP